MALSDADYAVHIDKINAETQARNGVANRVCGACTACCAGDGGRRIEQSQLSALFT